MRKTTNINMKALLGVLLILLSSGICFSQECQQMSSQAKETTHWVGNLQIVNIKKKPLQNLSGIVKQPDGKPLKGALVEVFTKPEYLLVETPVDKRGAPNQVRIAVCKTKENGRFSFTNLPAGKYELRSSSSDSATGWNVTQIYVILNPKNRKKEQIVVEMSLGI
jgi:protocatechuate 3,4-dioxygenase beta subunit